MVQDKKKSLITDEAFSLQDDERVIENIIIILPAKQFFQ